MKSAASSPNSRLTMCSVARISPLQNPACTSLSPDKEQWSWFNDTNSQACMCDTVTPLPDYVSNQTGSVAHYCTLGLGSQDTVNLALFAWLSVFGSIMHWLFVAAVRAHLRTGGSISPIMPKSMYARRPSAVLNRFPAHHNDVHQCLYFRCQYSDWKPNLGSSCMEAALLTWVRIAVVEALLQHLHAEHLQFGGPLLQTKTWAGIDGSCPHMCRRRRLASSSQRTCFILLAGGLCKLQRVWGKEFAEP